MVLYGFSVQVPSNVVSHFVHDGGDVTATAVHMLATLHTNTVKRRRAPCVSAVLMLGDGRERDFVMSAYDLD